MTIARGRNAVKQRGSAHWAMFVDDDVLLDLDCVATLLDELVRSPALGAVAADYGQERQRADYTGHVAMGACLFRSNVLQQIQFRWADNSCECQCCCDDLRGGGFEIAYSARAKATHLGKHLSVDCDARQRFESSSRPGVVLAAFDRRDLQKFERQF